MKHYLRFIYVLAILFITDPGWTYPLDAYPDTGIRRIEAARLAVFGKMRGRRQPPGCRFRRPARESHRSSAASPERPRFDLRSNVRTEVPRTRDSAC